MQFSVVSLVLLCAVSRALTAPAMKQDPGSELKEQMKNFQDHVSRLCTQTRQNWNEAFWDINGEDRCTMASLGDQFKTVFQTVMKEKKLGKSNSVHKRGMEANSMKENGKKDIREKLKEVSKQLTTMHEQLNSLRKKVYNMKKLLRGNGNDDDDDDDLDLDRREIKSPSKDANSPECIKSSIVQENDPFILRIALAIMKRINAMESRMYIEKLVNATADHLIAKMGATHGTKDFHKKLLNAVLQLLKVRSILTIKTEGEFIDKLDLRKSRTLETADPNVNQSKVVQALEELLEGPLIKGFVSKVEEEKMIDSAVKSLKDAFGLSKNRTKSVIRKMISHVEEDIKAREHGKEQGKPMTDDEKIKGLEKIVVDKVEENKFNIKEMKYLVKGLAAAVGARNILSASKTKKLENRILKGVQDYFAKLKLSENKDGNGVKQDMLKKFEELQVPTATGFNTTPSESHNGDRKLDVHKSAKGSVDENIKKTLLDNLQELKKLTSKLSSHSLTSLTGDTGDKVTIDAATNTRGSTKIVEEHNIKREHMEATKIVPTKSVTEPKETNIDAVLNELQKLITTIKARVPSSKTKTREKVFVHAAKGTIGERKFDTGFERKRGLAAIVADAISLIKSLKEKQQKSTESTKRLATTKALQTTVVTTTLEPKVERTKSKGTPSESVQAKEKKSEISDVMKAEIEKAEAEIQKELEEQQKAEEKAKLLAEEKNAGKKVKESEKVEEKEKQKQKEEEEREKQKQEEEQEREKQKQEEEQEREKQKQKEEAAMEKKQKNEKQKLTVQQQKNQGNKTKKNDIPGESKEQIESDEKEIEMELEAQTNGKDKLINKLQSLQTKQKNNEKSKKPSHVESSELIKELDELFAKN